MAHGLEYIMHGPPGDKPDSFVIPYDLNRVVFDKEYLYVDVICTSHAFDPCHQKVDLGIERVLGYEPVTETILGKDQCPQAAGYRLKPVCNIMAVEPSPER